MFFWQGTWEEIRASQQEIWGKWEDRIIPVDGDDE